MLVANIQKFDEGNDTGLLKFQVKKWLKRIIYNLFVFVKLQIASPHIKSPFIVGLAQISF